MWLIKAHTSQEAPTSTSGSGSLYDFWKKKITKKDFIIFIHYILIGEPLPLIEVGASWEVCAFVSHIYLPSSSGSPYPDIFF